MRVVCEQLEYSVYLRFSVLFSSLNESSPVFPCVSIAAQLRLCYVGALARAELNFSAALQQHQLS